MTRLGARRITDPEPLEWTWLRLVTVLTLPHGIAAAFLGLLIL